MNTIRTIHLVYFSGTGGTKRVSEYIQAALEARGVKVITTELTRGHYQQKDADFLIILYPVYAMNAPNPVDEWIASAQEGNGKPAAVLSVSGGGEVTPNMACRVGAIRRLEGKGYRVTYESMFIMPSNIFIQIDDTLCAMLFKASQLKVKRVISDILAGKTVRTKPHVVDRVLAKLGLVEKRALVFFSKKLKASEQCSGCSWCASHCPRHNITMRNGKPSFGKECVACLCCIYGCPQKAIEAGKGKILVLKSGYNLEGVEQRIQSITEFPTASIAARGFGLHGVRQYLEENLEQEKLPSSPKV